MDGLETIKRHNKAEVERRIAPNPHHWMGEARLVAPTLDNQGEPVTTAHTALRNNLLAHFAGFTGFVAEGGWRDPRTDKVFSEPVIVYDIACPPTADAAVKLHQCAVQFLRDARQEGVYLRYSDGNTVIVN